MKRSFKAYILWTDSLCSTFIFYLLTSSSKVLACSWFFFINDFISSLYRSFNFMRLFSCSSAFISSSCRDSIYIKIEIPDCWGDSFIQWSILFHVQVVSTCIFEWWFEHFGNLSNLWKFHLIIMLQHHLVLLLSRYLCGWVRNCGGIIFFFQEVLSFYFFSRLLFSRILCRLLFLRRVFSVPLFWAELFHRGTIICHT